LATGKLLDTKIDAVDGFAVDPYFPQSRSLTFPLVWQQRRDRRLID